MRKAYHKNDIETRIYRLKNNKKSLSPLLFSNLTIF